MAPRCDFRGVLRTVALPERRPAIPAERFARPDRGRFELVAELYAELRGPFQRGLGGPGGWWLIPDVDVRLAQKEALRADLCGWRRETLPDFPAERPVARRPDWICEGLSAGRAPLDPGSERAVSARGGVPWCWVVDPRQRTLSILRLTDGGYVVERAVGDSGLVRLPPFEAVPIELARIFPPA